MMSSESKGRGPELAAPLSFWERLSLWLAAPGVRDSERLRISLGGALLAFLTAALCRGRVHPDEVYQLLEPAFRLAFGYGEVMWEWKQGVRNWLFPGLMGGLFRLEALLGIHASWPRMAGLWLVLALGFALALRSAHRLVTDRDGPEAARWGTVALATWGGTLVFAARPLADSLAIAPLLIALERLESLKHRPSRHAAWQAGAALGVAVAARYPSLVFAAPLGLSLLWSRRWRQALEFSLGALAVGLAIGLLDLFTWGEFLHSFRAYLAFNRPGGEVETKFGSMSLSFYVGPFFGMAPVALLPFALMGIWEKRDLLVGSGAFYALFIQLHPHKESRFLLPLLVGIPLVAGAPMARWLAPRLAGRTRHFIVGVLIWILLGVLAATIQRPMAWRQGAIDATVVIGEDPELGSMVSLTREQWAHGGRVYLNRTNTVHTANKADPGATRRWLADPAVTHLLVMEELFPTEEIRAAGFTVWRTFDSVVVWKRPAGVSPPESAHP